MIQKGSVINMLVTVVFLGLVVLASAEEVARKAMYGNQDMFAESTIVRQGYAYPGIGSEGIGYRSSIGYTTGGAGPFYGPEKVGGFGGIGLAQGGYYPGLEGGIKYAYEPVGPVSFGYQQPIIPKYGGYLTEEKFPVPIVAPKVPIIYAAPPVSYANAGPIGGAIAPIGGYGGGEFVNKNIYGEGQKELKDQQFKKSYGKEGEEFEEGKEGFNRGNTGIKEVKSDSGYYSDEEGAKKLAEDAKNYYGGHHYNQEGKFLTNTL